MSVQMYAGQRVYVRASDTKHFIPKENNTDLSLGKRIAKYHEYKPELASSYAKAFVLVMTTPRHLFSTIRFQNALKSLFPRTEVYWNAMCTAINTSMQRKREQKKFNIPCPGGDLCIWTIWSEFIETMIEPVGSYETFKLIFTPKTDYDNRSVTAQSIDNDNIEFGCPFHHDNIKTEGLMQIFSTLKTWVRGAFLEYMQCCANGIDYINAILNKDLLKSARINQEQCIDQVNNHIRSVLISFVIANIGSMNDYKLRLSESDKDRLQGNQHGDEEIGDKLLSQVIRIGATTMFYSEIYKFPEAFAKLFVGTDV